MERGFVCTGGLARHSVTIEEVHEPAEPYAHECGQLVSAHSDPARVQRRDGVEERAHGGAMATRVPTEYLRNSCPSAPDPGSVAPTAPTSAPTAPNGAHRTRRPAAAARRSDARRAAGASGLGLGHLCDSRAMKRLWPD